MTFSPLISGTLPHHNKYSLRHNAISEFVPHHWAGISGGDATLTNPNVQASASYIIYSDGRIFGQVPEEFRPWTSGDGNVDSRAITYEVQDATGQVNGNDDDPLSWQISAAALDAVIRLSADVAKRNGIAAISTTNFRGHRQIVQTSCPGGYFWRKFPQLRSEINRILTGSTAVPSTPVVVGKSIGQLADEVIAGQHGSGAERQATLGSQYQEVQNEVNRRLGVSTVKAPLPAVKSISQLADETINGVYGNGAERQAKLGSNYQAVQNEINRRFGGTSPSAPSVNINALADAVIRGDYGNGADRQARLGANYAVVQAEINRRYS